MPTNKILKQSSTLGIGYGPGHAGLYVDTDDNKLKFNPDGTERVVLDATNGITTVQLEDGTAAAPSMTFDSDLDSGIYRIGANNIGIALGGAIEWNLTTSALSPGASDGSALGTTALMWSDLFLASGAVVNFDNGDVTFTHAANNLTIAGGTLSPGEGLDFTGLTPAASPISLTGVTLASNTNAIRGVNIAPNRVSGWTCFTGTTAMSAYMDYREMHTADASLIYGSGFFPFMDSGASCASMSAIQAICQADAGATVTTAASAQGTGIYPIWAKALINSAAVDSGAQIAAAWLSVQANVTDISGRASAIIHAEVASGALRDLIYFNATGGVLSTYFLNVSAATSPFLAWGADNQPNAATADLGIKCLVGATEYWIPLYVNT